MIILCYSINHDSTNNQSNISTPQNNKKKEQGEYNDIMTIIEKKCDVDKNVAFYKRVNIAL